MEVFQIPFMQMAVIVSLLITTLCAYLAVFVVLKRIVFVGVALAQMSSAGVALALLIGFSPTVLSLVFMLAGVALFSLRQQERQVPRESIIGITYAAAAAIGVILIAKSAQGESRMLNLLFGNVLAVKTVDIYVMLGVFLPVAALHLLFQKEFIFTSFDYDTATTLGVRARRWDLLFYLTLGMTIATAIRTAGALLVFAMLVIPGVTALILSRRMSTAFGVSIVAGLVPVVLGLYLSFILDLPSAAAIVFLSFLLLCIALPISKLIPR